MPSASIMFQQGDNTNGAGYALMGTVGTEVVVSNGDNSHIVAWTFEVLDVGAGSAIAQGVVQSGTSPTWSFIPDAAGGELIRLTVQDDEGNLYVDERVFGVLETNGLFIPPFMANSSSLNFIIGAVENTKGWSPFVNAWLELIEAGATPTVTPILRINETSGISSIVVSGPVQYIGIDTSSLSIHKPGTDGVGPSVHYFLPTGCADGQVLEVFDLKKNGSWGVRPPTLQGVNEGIQIESPTNAGSFNSSQTALAQNGGSWTLVYAQAETTWFTV